jgi:hypothetical protein
MVESRVVSRMNLLLSFVNLCVQEFYEFVCVVSQMRKIKLEDNKDPDSKPNEYRLHQKCLEPQYSTNRWIAKARLHSL